MVFYGNPCFPLAFLYLYSRQGTQDMEKEEDSATVEKRQCKALNAARRLPRKASSTLNNPALTRLIEDAINKARGYVHETGGHRTGNS